MAKNPESDDQAKIDGPISPSVAADAVNEEATMLRADAAHTSGPARPNFLNAKQPKTAAVQPTRSRVVSEGSAIASESKSSDSSADDYEFLPPKLRQRMQALMAELSLEEEPVEEVNNELPEDSIETEQEIEAATEIELQQLGQQISEDQQHAEAMATDSTEAAAEVTSTEVKSADVNSADVIVPQPGDLVELVENENTEETSSSLFDEIDQEELARLGIQTHPIGSDSETTESATTTTAEEASTIPFVEIATDNEPMLDNDMATPDEVALETVKYMDPVTLQQLQDESQPSTASLELNAADQQELDRQQELTDTTETFSQQAGEILEILKQKQIELSRYREQLAIGKARTENELRQQRLELVEKKREFLEEVSQFRKSLKQRQAARSRSTLQTDKLPEQHTNQERPAEPQQQDAVASVGEDSANANTTPIASGSGSQGRKITLESIAMPGRQTRASVEPAATMQEARPVDIDGLDARNLDPAFLAVIEQHLSETRSSGNAIDAADTPVVQTSAPVVEPFLQQQGSVRSLSQARLQQQAESLKKQHSAAVGSLRKTRRQLELLRNVVVQQQQQTAERASDLDLEHEQWTSTRSMQMQELDVDRRELDRLTAVRENELSKRETAALQRENAVRQLEAKLQQAQVEILRDRVILRQLERTARQTLSNTQWNDRLAIITEETEGYLRQMQAQAEQMKAEAGKQIKRLDSRQSELLLYRESLRNWVQRQMKLISRRSAHLEEREENVQQRWQAISDARTELQNHQHALNEIIRGGLNQIDDQLDEPGEQRLNDAA